MPPAYQLPDPTQRAFARTNVQTIQQRATLLRELLPDTCTIAELCCGDCSAQDEIYRSQLHIERYVGLDLQPEIVAANRARSIECVQGDALDPKVVRRFVDFDVIFFGPPLSVDCDGHHGLAFRDITPGYADFARLLLVDLHFDGTLICIGPKTTHLGDSQWLSEQIGHWRSDVNLRLIHHSYSTVTGAGASTEPRLKYVELWFSMRLPNAWELRTSGLDTARVAMDEA
jgi:hypothetical protein